jgi:hypothetical protein
MNIPLTGLMLGEYVFRLKVTDNRGATATTTVKVIVNNRNGEDVYCNVYPNPTASVLNVQYISNSTGTARIALYDANKRYIWGETVPKTQAVLTRTIDMSRYRAGIYYLEITIGREKLTKKITKL